MRSFACFSAAIAWALAVCGVAGWALTWVNPDRRDVDVLTMASATAVLVAATVLVVGGWVVAYHYWDDRGR
jgi:hypothetical protein